MPKYQLTRRDFLKASGASLFLAGLPLPGFTKEKPPGTISVII
jgi:anaerobic selenocysteine-containing dehydrogenase